jgi:hypothetical protein
MRPLLPRVLACCVVPQIAALGQRHTSNVPEQVDLLSNWVNSRGFECLHASGSSGRALGLMAGESLAAGHTQTSLGLVTRRARTLCGPDPCGCEQDKRRCLPASRSARRLTQPSLSRTQRLPSIRADVSDGGSRSARLAGRSPVTAIDSNPGLLSASQIGGPMRYARRRSDPTAPCSSPRTWRRESMGCRRTLFSSLRDRLRTWKKKSRPRDRRMRA